MRRFNQNLKCIFTPEEKATRSEQNCKRIVERAEQKAEAARIAKNFKAHIELLDQDIEDTAKLLEQGFEFRQVECEMQPDFAEGEMVIIRTDTGEIVKRRPLEPEERQASFIEEREESLVGQVMQAAADKINNGAMDSDGVTCKATVKGVNPMKVLGTIETPNNPGFDRIVFSGPKTKAEIAAEEAESKDSLTLEDYLDFAELGTTEKYPMIKAREWMESGELDKTIREWLKMKRAGESPKEDFTADKCSECQRIDGAHDQNCTLHPDFRMTPAKSARRKSQPTAAQ